MDFLKDIIQRCHQRHGEKLRQRKTVVQPEMYRSTEYRFKAYYARTHSIMLDEIERADISFMPIGHAPENSLGPRDLGGERFLTRQGVEDWRFKRWFASWGIQIYTGIPSERNGARWHDLSFTYQAICAAPEAVFACIEGLVNTVTNPLLTLTNSGGLRFSCRVPDYLHSNSDQARQYIYKHTPTTEDPYQREVYLEILGKEGYSPWDTRYEILIGDLLNPPVISKEILFVPIDTLRAALHEPAPLGEKPPKTSPVTPVSLGSDNLDLAKEACVQRGFSYLREDIGFHHWTRTDSEGSETHLSFWEVQGIVWVRSTTPNCGLPTRAVPITDVWDDTGITQPITDTGLLVTEKISAVREGKLSPLTIKRPTPTLHQDTSSEKVSVTLEEHLALIDHALEQDTRTLGIISDTVRERNYEIDPYLLQGGEICLNVPKRSLAEAAERQFQVRNVPSFSRWRGRLYRWELVKDIPVEDRMANPFERGNSCEDPERCWALEHKGGNPDESICPKCPVYTECQQRGYLSQPLKLRNAKAQVVTTYQLFLDPHHRETLEKIIEPVDEKERICIVDEFATELQHLFLQCGLTRGVLQEWTVSWQGRALGNFAKVILNATEPHQVEPNVSAITQVRAAMQAFQPDEEEIIMQMCHLNVQGKVVTRGMVDTDTGQELAHYSIDFEGGVSAYIPLDSNAKDKLRAKELPVLPVDVLDRNAEIPLTGNIEVPMRMAQAITLGIVDIETVQKIQQLPTVFKDTNWTFWHQLKAFFAHYKRDTDAPMRWDSDSLRFWIPPVLHPSVKRLLLISPKLSGRHLRRVFPDQDVEIARAEPTAWVPGNHVFQTRSGIYSHHTILNYDSNWDILGLSKMGERIFFRTRAEIDRDPTVKHAIITNKPITKFMTDLTEYDNVCFVTNFKKIDDVDFEEPEVIWILGTTHYSQNTIWRQAQTLFGNDDQPLYYEGDFESGHYKDERIQGVYQQHIVGMLTQAVRYAGLNRFPNKKVVLLTSVALPDITDRPETLLFDWEDFEVAGGLDKLPDVIATRERYEAESARLTADTSREEVERVLGCSDRQANRVLVKLRGGTTQRVSFREQILAALAEGEKRPIELTEIIGGHQRSVLNVLKHLVDIGEVEKVRRGVYKLPEK